MASVVSSAESLSPSDANLYLQEIRRNKGVDNPDGLEDDNVKDLNNSLNLLSEQLYSKQTHFLLELIQNADDNNYVAASPTLSFITDYPADQLLIRIDCNESGFTRKNIKAICSIGQSTKGVVDRSKGFIGEKGIGFKSAFKVAYEVYISSGPFQFKFDSRPLLGMIAPIVEPFPRNHLISNQTQILLRLKGPPQLEAINAELDDIKPNLLIFLRKLSPLKIRSPSQNLKYSIFRRDRDPYLQGETATLTVFDIADADNYRPKKRREYVIVRQEVKNLPKCEHRAGVESTEAVLAFPVDEETNPVIRKQNAFAFLPIGSYGFSFLIQADFLLIANREGVDVSEPWNKRLRTRLVDAFRKAVFRFNETNWHTAGVGLRYTWHRFLKDHGCNSNFWSTLRADILKDLRKEQIFRSRCQEAKLRAPTSLQFIPSKFRLDGKPLIERESKKASYLSFNYDSESSQLPHELKILGITEMSGPDFVHELKRVIQETGPDFLKKQSLAWHAKLCTVLRQVTSKSQIADLPLIPLRDGEWVKCSAPHTYLGTALGEAEVPRGIDVNLVHADACRNLEREAFFRWLGISTCDEAQVCRLIMGKHVAGGKRQTELFLSDALFLFNTPPSIYNESLKGLHLLTRDSMGKARIGKWVYVDDPRQSFKVSQYANNEESGVQMLHPDYFTKIEGNKSEFVDWLVQRCGVSTLPRLVRDKFRTKEFEFLMMEEPEQLLLLLRDNWAYYLPQLQESFSGSTQDKVESVLHDLSEMEVACTDGIFWPLEQTVLPLHELKEIGTELPFLDIPDPEDERWIKLEKLGVITTTNLQLYLRQLQAVASLDEADDVDVSAITKLYDQIEARSKSKSGPIKVAFTERNLVFDPTAKEWIGLEECVWEGPPCLTKYFILSNYYPDCKSLFVTRLDVKNASTTHIIEQLLHFASEEGTPGGRFKEALLVLNEYLRRSEELPSSLTKLKGKEIIPVTRISSGEDEYKIMDHDTDLWYLADKPSLQASFEEDVWLADFAVSEVRSLSPLVRALSLEEYILSTAVEEEMESRGEPIFDQARTMDLRHRVIYFTRFVQFRVSHKAKSGIHDKLASQLRGLKVWGVEAITIKRYVDDVEGKEDSGDVILHDMDDQLDIYLPINISDRWMSNPLLAEAFIKHCGITDPAYQPLALHILTVSIPNIDKMLERHNLDGSDDVNVGKRLSETLFASHNIAREQASDTEDINGDTIPPTPSTPSIGAASALRSNIPTLDASLAKVREGAASHKEGTSFSVFSPAPSSTQRVRKPSINSSSEFSINSGQSEAIDNEPAANYSEVFQFTGTSNSDVSFDIGSLRSALPDIGGLETPARNTLAAPTSSSRPRSRSRSPGYAPVEGENTLEGMHLKHIGLLGETFIYEYFSQRLPNWSEDNWTSKSRVEAGHSPFLNLERDYADFTYFDSDRTLTSLLVEQGMEFAKQVLEDMTSPLTYHLEVKATTASCGEAFYMSNNQIEKARKYKIPAGGTPVDIYVILRVYDLQNEGRPPKFVAYVDPWGMYMEGTLRLISTDKFMVTAS